MENNEKNLTPVCMSALYPYEEINIPEAVEKSVSGKDFIAFGEDNQYPYFLYGLYKDCGTLQAIINGTLDYILGDEIICQSGMTANRNGETYKDIVYKIASDYLIFGGFYLNVIRNREGKISEIYWLDYRNMRTDKKNEAFFYSEDWSTKTYGRVKYTVYPRFSTDPELAKASSVYFYKSPVSRGVYATPVWEGSIKYALIDVNIADYHLSELENNFAATAIINYNNGQPTDEQKAEIERDLEDKFSGTKNAARFVISFNSDKEHATEIQRIQTDDVDKRYNDLAKRTTQQLFIGFRATPALFGLMTESKGFSNEEFAEAFKLYNRTTVKPVQANIIDTLDKIFGTKGFLTIIPFTMEGQTEDNVD